MGAVEAVGAWAMLGAGGGTKAPIMDMTGEWFGIVALILFGFAYIFVILEEALHLRKSKPVLVAAGVIWALVGAAAVHSGHPDLAGEAVRHNLLEFVELLLFLLAAMTFINTMDERNVFRRLRAILVSRGFGLRSIFWITGALSFVISPIADNLTTALLMSTVVMSVGAGNAKFIAIACTNVVVAANAGGAFSPFGDITTLMVWQAGKVAFEEFLVLIVPSLVNWLVPAALMVMFIPKAKPAPIQEESPFKPGAWVVIGLFLCTVTLAVSFHRNLHLPPAVGMMAGLGLLKIYGYFIRLEEKDNLDPVPEPAVDSTEDLQIMRRHYKPREKPFDIFISVKRVEWDTLLFFYGVILCVGGLSTLGYLQMLSEYAYGDLGSTQANIWVGVLSAIVDNIPVMFAVLVMDPQMAPTTALDHWQWLLVTLTAGVGGSLLSVGSAAGVAVMGQARGYYTFFSHLKWTWAIALGYAASIWAHWLINHPGPAS